jgi:hypothetical protein
MTESAQSQQECSYCGGRPLGSAYGDKLKCPSCTGVEMDFQPKQSEPDYCPAHGGRLNGKPCESCRAMDLEEQSSRVNHDE